MPNPWDDLIRFIEDGENVEANVANRSPEALARRTQYLKDILDALSASEALFVRNVAVEADAVPGDAMYYDDTTNTYKRALAAVELDTAFGWYTTAKSSFVVGLLYSKADTQLGTIVSLGMLRDFDWSAGIESGSLTTPGPYYLSTSQPGKMTIMQPPISVYVLYNTGDGRIHITPTPKDVLEDHIHYKFDLFPDPAGDTTCLTYDEWLIEGRVHEVVNADSDLPGWLPATDPVFNGLAPEGAKFGYNLALHPELERVWPPMPLESVHVEMNGRSIELADGRCPMMIADANGLWWLQDCYGAAPWAPDYPGCIPVSSSASSSSSSSGDECECQPPVEYMPGNSLDNSTKTLTLWFSKMVFKTDASVVTSLQPDGENSPITITDCEGEEASTGRLFAGLDLSKLELEEPVDGYNAVKGFGPNKYQRGPIVSGLKPGSGAAIAGIGTEGADWELDEETGLYRGNLLVGLEDNLNDPREGQPSLVAVDNVRQEYDNISQFFYLVFPGGRTSSVRNRLEIPRIDMSADPIHLKLWFWFVGRSAGALPTLEATYRRYPQPTGVDTLPSSDTDIVAGGWDPGLTFAGGDYAYAETPFFDVEVGDTVFFTIGSDGTGPSDGFGIMRFGWRTEVK